MKQSYKVHALIKFKQEKKLPPILMTSLVMDASESSILNYLSKYLAVEYQLRL